jgi:hypothetical protein
MKVCWNCGLYVAGLQLSIILCYARYSGGEENGLCPFPYLNSFFFLNGNGENARFVHTYRVVLGEYI